MYCRCIWAWWCCWLYVPVSWSKYACVTSLACVSCPHILHLPSISWSKYLLPSCTQSPLPHPHSRICAAHSLAPNNTPDGVHLDWQSYLERSVHCIVSLVLKGWHLCAVFHFQILGAKHFLLSHLLINETTFFASTELTLCLEDF